MLEMVLELHITEAIPKKADANFAGALCCAG